MFEKGNHHDGLRLPVSGREPERGLRVRFLQQEVAVQMEDTGRTLFQRGRHHGRI